MTLTRDKKKIILADKISGIEAVPFASSILPYVIENANKRLKFKVPFWAFSVPKDKSYGTEWADNVAYQKVTNSVLDFIKTPKGLSYFRQIKKKITQEEKILNQMAQNLRFNLSNLSDLDLVKQYKKFIEKYTYYYGLGVLDFLYGSGLSDKLVTSLTSRYPQAVKFLPGLFRSSYRSFMFLNEDSLWHIKQEKNQQQRQLLVRQYINNFFYLRATYVKAPIITEKFVLKQIKGLERHEVEEFSPIPLSIKLKVWEKQIISLLKISEVIRDKRKQINMIGSYMMFRFLDEAVKRCSISNKLAIRSFWFEYEDLVLNTSKISLILKKRQEFSLIYKNRQIFYCDYIAIRERSELDRDIRKFSGTSAASGLYQGKVRLVLNNNDLFTFHLGEILVADMTRPEFLPAMRKAGAIITNEGGLTCHAAIVARELNIPCIVGAKIATKILKNGDRVIVDANKGIIEIVKKIKNQKSKYNSY